MKVEYLNKFIDIQDPNVCPHCHVVNAPNNIWKIFSHDTDDTPVFIFAWTCSNQECKKVFISLHRLYAERFIFARFLNGLPKGPIWPKPISDLKNGNPQDSSNPETTRFIKTYLQSLVSENSGLDELAGMGYRKAIEYLVKDWAIQGNPTDKDKIEALWLGQVISSYYDGDLKDILERATWLGNDQAHYNRVFEEYDVSHLKELIDLIMVELDRQYKKKHYIDTIQKRK
ncbi:MAG TPA: hypothetical protein VE978_12735 [Chitinophagales bacterium]|nr:hypothetical protein [Chitinophagales bacterium]